MTSRVMQFVGVQRRRLCWAMALRGGPLLQGFYSGAWRVSVFNFSTSPFSLVVFHLLDRRRLHSLAVGRQHVSEKILYVINALLLVPLSLSMRLRHDWVGYSCPFILGIAITARILTLRNASADRRTFKLWALWTVCLYSLPLLGRRG